MINENKKNHRELGKQKQAFRKEHKNVLYLIFEKKHELVDQWFKYFQKEVNGLNGERPAIMQAIHSGEEMINILIRHGASLTKTDQGRSALQLASHMGYLKVVQCLLNAGAPINQPSHSAQATALHFAIEGEQMEIVEYLIGQGADLELKNKEGENALQFAIRKHQNKITQYIEGFLLAKNEKRVLENLKNHMSPIKSDTIGVINSDAEAGSNGPSDLALAPSRKRI